MRLRALFSDNTVLARTLTRHHIIPRPSTVCPCLVISFTRLLSTIADNRRTRIVVYAVKKHSEEWSIQAVGTNEVFGTIADWRLPTSLWLKTNYALGLCYVNGNTLEDETSSGYRTLRLDFLESQLDEVETGEESTLSPLSMGRLYLAPELKNLRLRIKDFDPFTGKILCWTSRILNNTETTRQTVLFNYL
ncbi:hypothetical protein NP233_g11478 [Leucocoprinus birnbaumii]|uniref:Uncharacterized protein n=1 Tax=Leucocoprinus birnbaumii TaxID=56174 RepID=A0AAD5VIV3_9AGAR|nr:hypothetical protein NP233_g11478 [Leucocoprinus birnbaumii]